MHLNRAYSRTPESDSPPSVQNPELTANDLKIDGRKMIHFLLGFAFREELEKYIKIIALLGSPARWAP